MRRLTILTISFSLIFAAGSLQAAGKGKGKGPNKTGDNVTTTTFVDGFNDSITNGLLCPWEQLNPCEGRNEVFVLDATKKANGSKWFDDPVAAGDLETGHTDVCMNEKDAPTTITLWELSPKPINLGSEHLNGCTTPCNMLVRPTFTNRLSCHENIRLKQEQALLLTYSLEEVKEHTRARDNFFCHPDYLPKGVDGTEGVKKEECLGSTETYCHRGLDHANGETAEKYMDYLELCIAGDETY